VFQVRDRRLAGRASFLLENPEDADDPRILRAFITQYYPKATAVPREVIVPVAPEEPASTAAWLASRREGGVTLTVAADGDGRKLVDLAATNAAEALEQAKAEFLTDAERTAEALAELQEALELPNLPHRLECYDISNIQGTNSVASMVVFEGGRPKKSDYRKFKIKTVQGADDFASMAEVVRRRFTRALEAQTRTDGGAGEPDESFATVPDLVIVDGGKGQLAAAKAVLDELEFSEVPIVGLAKEREEIFRPGDPDPILLPRTSQGLYLVQRVRDEAHRFALGYHRQRRGAQARESLLDELEGVGPARRRALLRHFGSVERVLAASPEELEGVPGLPPKTARSVYAQLHRAGRP
jgi:excinuclease ABC subunit C